MVLRTAWVFPGVGSLLPGMGRELLACDRHFAAALRQVEPIVVAETGWRPQDRLAERGPWSAEDAEVLTVVLQLALAEAVTGRGAQPDAVIGMSLGDVAALVVAGVLDPLEAVRFACRRAKAVGSLEGTGAGVVVHLAPEQVTCAVVGVADVIVRDVSMPGRTWMAGDRDAVLSLVAGWRTDGVEVDVLNTSIAYHTRYMEPAVEAVRRAAASLRPRPARIPVYSMMLPEAVVRGLPDVEFWVANMCDRGYLVNTLRTAIADGYRAFLEFAVEAGLANWTRKFLSETGADSQPVARVLQRGCGELESLHTALAVVAPLGPASDD